MTASASSQNYSRVSQDSQYSEFILKSSEIYNDQRSHIQKAGHRILGVVREIGYTFKNIHIRLVDRFHPKFDRLHDKKVWQAESEGLYVLVHGLNGTPGIWQSQVEQFKQDKNKDLFVPYVLLKGNGPLETVATPLLDVIKDYAAKNPDVVRGYDHNGIVAGVAKDQVNSCKKWMEHAQGV
jgi:hypothetical protein